MRTLFTRAAVAAGLFLVFLASTARAAPARDDFPILTIPRTAGVVALLRHEFTSAEGALFHAIDAQTARLPRRASDAEYREIAIQEGARYGLDAEQSVAFFVRATFSLFESE